MTKTFKRTFTLILAILLVGVLALPTFAAEDDIDDEAEIYSAEFEPFASPRASSSDSGYRLEGTRSWDISNSPAVRGDGTNSVTVAPSTDEDEVPDDDQDNTDTSPSTGAPSLAFPISAAVLSLGSIAAVWKKK